MRVAAGVLLLGLAYALLYFPGESSFLAGLEQAKWTLAYGLVTALLLGRLLAPTGPATGRIRAVPALVSLALPFLAAPGGWVWGRDPELITLPLAAIVLLAVAWTGLPRGLPGALTGLALLAPALYLAGVLGGLGVLPALGYTPFLERTSEFFPRAFTWPSPGYAAGVLAPLGAFFAVRYAIGGRSAPDLVASSVLLALLLAGGNRTGPAALGLAVLIALLPTIRAHRLPAVTAAFRLAAVAAAAALLFAVYPLPGTRPTTLERGLRDLPTFNSRTYLWQGALSLLAEHPLGVGPDRFLGTLALSEPEQALRMIRAFGVIPREATEVVFLSDTPLARVQLPGAERPLFIQVGNALAHNGFLDLALAYGIPVAVLVYLGWLLWMVRLYRSGNLALLAANLTLFFYSLLWTPIFSVLFPFVALNRLALAKGS